MENNNESKNLLTGLIIAGIVGAATVYLYRSSKPCKEVPVAQKIGRTLSNLGEMLESGNFNCEKISHNLENSREKASDVLTNAIEWAETGLKLWNKFK